MSEFHAAHPDYVTTSRLDELRATEYSYLDSTGHTYLDYTAAGLMADAQLRAHIVPALVAPGTYGGQPQFGDRPARVRPRLAALRPGISGCRRAA
jgi:hypothetical protein